MSQKQPLSPNKRLQNGASVGVDLDSKKPAVSIKSVPAQSSKTTILLGQNGEGGTVIGSMKDPFANRVGTDSIGVKASNPFDSPIGISIDSRTASAFAASPVTSSISALARTSSTALPTKTNPVGEAREVAAPASSSGTEEDDKKPSAKQPAEERQVRKRNPPSNFIQECSKKLHEDEAAKVAAKAAKTLAAKATVAAAAPAAEGTNGGGEIVLYGETYDVQDFMVKKVDGKFDYSHRALSMIEHVGRLVAADPSRDCELTAGGHIGTAIIRELMGEGFLPWITKNRQIYDLTARLANCCCEEGCFQCAGSKKAGGDGTQCTECYLDQKDGKDRARQGMLNSFSVRQKVYILKCLRAKKWGLWTPIIDGGGEILEGKTRSDVRRCAEWLVKNKWYKLQKGDEERGEEWRRANLSANVHKMIAAKKSGK